MQLSSPPLNIEILPSPTPTLTFLKIWSEGQRTMPILKFCLWVKNVQNGVSCTSVDRKMKIKSKHYFEVNFSFIKLFIEFLNFWLSLMIPSTQKFLGKRRKLVSHVLMAIEDENEKYEKPWVEVCIYGTIFLKSWNSSPVLWCHGLKIGSKRLKFVYHVQLVVKILKSRTTL